MSQLGLDYESDAHMATKQAVYCILYNRDVEEEYRGVDSRGEKIKAAMKKMVDEGRNGTRKPESGNITLNKVGGFVEDGNYYTQTYEVTSSINMSEYTITSTSGMPSRRIDYKYK